MTLIESLRVTLELTGTTWSEATIRQVLRELRAYPEPAVLEALARCRAEVRRLTFADILDRLPGSHPGPEEAWAIASTVLGNEWASVCWTDEIREAAAVAAPLAHDRVAARQAFREAYVRLLSEARAARRPPVWSVSPGWDAQGREACAAEAAQRNRIAASLAERWQIAGPSPEEARALLTRIDTAGKGTA